MNKVLRRKFCSNAQSNFDSLISKYSVMNPELESLQKQLIFRSSNMGMLELDVLVGRWAKLFVPKLNEKECLAYNDQILQMETPDIWNILIQNKMDPKLTEIYQQSEYLKIIREYGLQNPFKAGDL